MMSKEADPLREALEGFKDTARYPIGTPYNIDGDLNQGRKFLEEIESKAKPGLLFTLGAPALQVATSKREDLAAVFSMVFNPAKILGERSKNITGVSMDVPVAEVLESIKELSPPVRRLGVLFNPTSSQAMILEITLAARKRDIQLVDAGVNARSQLPHTLQSIRAKIDALWILPDPTVLASGVVDYVLLWSHRNKIPVVGQAEQHTDKGALLSFSAGSSREMGREAGELATRILRGEKPAAIRPVVSRPAKLTVNPNTAKKLGVEIPDRLLERAGNLVQAPVYEEGDWWVFQVTRKDKPPETYRVTYKNGQFESDHPDFLSVSKDPHAISWLPLISINVQGPKKQWFRFPLFVGKEWEFSYQHTDKDSWGTRLLYGNFRVTRSVHSRVLREVPHLKTLAGTFDTMEIHRSVDVSQGSFNLVYFYSGESKSVVKLHGKGAIKQSIGLEKFDYNMELVGYGRGTSKSLTEVGQTRQSQLQAHQDAIKIDWSNVQAPTYKEGDWWVFRVTRADRPAQEYEVRFKNGRFVSTHPDFLKVSRHPDSISFLPLISVNLQGPDKRWFDFPLTPGHTWQFRYLHTSGHPGASGITGVGYRSLRSVRATVVGPTAEPISTVAGSFRAIEIGRIVNTKWGSFEFKYFYSAETNSTVRVAANGYAENVSGREEFGYEMELVAYGHGTSPDPLSVPSVTRQSRQSSGAKIDWSRIEAPVYEEGDWWLFRMTMGGTTQHYQVRYESGKLQSDLHGSQGAPLIMLSAAHPELRASEFPLVPGRTWKARYLHAVAESSLFAAMQTNLRAWQASGKVAEKGPVVTKTPAGKFKTVVLRREDVASTSSTFNPGYFILNLTGFYSPEVKGLVKVTGTARDQLLATDPFENHRLAIELVRFGKKESGGRSIPYVRRSAKPKD